MGEWYLTCPSEGVYRGECTYRKEGKTFVLTCPEGLEELKEGCQGVVGPGENPNPGLKEVEDGCVWTEEKVHPKEYFDPESFRTLCPQCPQARCALCPPEFACATRIIVGCPKGHFKGGRCEVGTEPHVIYHGRPK